MYLDYFQLREAPFNITPDPRFLYFSEKHQEAFNHLLYGVRERKGFIELTGEVGAGKTTICRRLLEQIAPTCRTALILNPFLSAHQLIKAVVHEFGLKARGVDRLAHLEALNEFLLAEANEGRTAVLVIDESQNLADELLEQVRLLSNLETDNAKLLQIILMGQPELRQKLAKPQLRQLRQRITVRYHLGPLDLAETAAYIAHRLHIAGANGQLQFEQDAVRAIHSYAEGIPRLVNAVCDKTLLAGFVTQTTTMTRPLVQLAIRELQGDCA